METEKTHTQHQIQHSQCVLHSLVHFFGCSLSHSLSFSIPLSAALYLSHSYLIFAPFSFYSERKTTHFSIPATTAAHHRTHTHRQTQRETHRHFTFVSPFQSHSPHSLVRLVCETVEIRQTIRLSHRRRMWEGRKREKKWNERERWRVIVRSINGWSIFLFSLSHLRQARKSGEKETRARSKLKNALSVSLSD